MEQTCSLEWHFALFVGHAFKVQNNIHVIYYVKLRIFVPCGLEAVTDTALFLNFWPNMSWQT